MWRSVLVPRVTFAVVCCVHVHMRVVGWLCVENIHTQVSGDALLEVLLELLIAAVCRQRLLRRLCVSYMNLVFLPVDIYDMSTGRYNGLILKCGEHASATGYTHACFVFPPSH